MADITVAPARLDDISELVAGLRKPDLDEIVASGVCPEFALEISLRRSTVAWAWRVDGRLACIIGVGPLCLLSDVGVPWMLGTDLVDKFPGALMRRAGRYIGIMRGLHPTLVNYVDVRNTRNIRWLKRLGFKFSGPYPYGPYQMPFYRFEMGD